MEVSENSATETVLHGPGAPAPPAFRQWGILVSPSLLSHNLHLNWLPKWIVWALKFEEHCLKDIKMQECLIAQFQPMDETSGTHTKKMVCNQWLCPCPWRHLHSLVHLSCFSNPMITQNSKKACSEYRQCFNFRIYGQHWYLWHKPENQIESRIKKSTANPCKTHTPLQI